MRYFKDAMITNNAIFIQMLGLCPTLAVTTTMLNGIGMGLATTFVLMGASAAVSLVKDVIPSGVRIPAYIIIIATFATMVDLGMNAFAHDLHKILGIFIPLIVVNCIVMGRAEAFASKHNVGASIIDALGSGLGFTIGLVALATIRELLGSGSLMGVQVLPDVFPPVLMFVLPPGAFFALAGLLAGFNVVKARRG